MDIPSARTDYANSWGPTPWLMAAEIFPFRARAKGVALSTVSNWMSNFVIAFITPPLFRVLSGGYYFVLAGFCIISGIFVFFVYPETSHVALEQLSQVFGDTALEPEKAEMRTPLQLAIERFRSTPASEDSGADKLLLEGNDTLSGSWTPSRTTLVDSPVDAPGNVNPDQPARM